MDPVSVLAIRAGDDGVCFEPLLDRCRVAVFSVMVLYWIPVTPQLRISPPAALTVLLEMGAARPL